MVDTSSKRPWLYDTTSESTWAVSAPYVPLDDGFPLIVGEVLASEPPTHLSLNFDARWDEVVAREPVGVLD